jgi:hypothetical protein
MKLVKSIIISRQSTDNRMPTHNRVYRRVITRDAGKAIEKASSLMAIANGVTGAINGAYRNMSAKRPC